MKLNSEKIIRKVKEKPVNAIVYMAIFITIVVAFYDFFKPNYVYLGETDQFVLYLNRKNYEKNGKSLTFEAVSNSKSSPRSGVKKFYINCGSREGAVLTFGKVYSEHFGEGNYISGSDDVKVFPWNKDFEKVCNILNP